MEWLWTLSPVVLCLGAALVAGGIRRLGTAKHGLAGDLVDLGALSNSLREVEHELAGLRDRSQQLAARAVVSDSSDHSSGR